MEAPMNLSFTINTEGKYGEVNEAIIDKLKNHRNEVSVPIGAGEFTKSEWDRFINRFDKAIDAVKETRKELLRQEEEKKEQGLIYRVTSSTDANEAYERMSSATKKLLGEGLIYYEKDIPYGRNYNPELNIVEINGIAFDYDSSRNAITLGDVSEGADCISVRLKNGGTLIFNIDDLESIRYAIGGFSPEDQGRILKAIAEHNHNKSMEKDFEEERNNIIRDLKSDKTEEEVQAEMMASIIEGNDREGKDESN